MLKVVATLIASNAQITTELARLHAALAQLAVAQSSSHITDSSSNLVGKEAIMTISDGSGAGSLAAYQEIRQRNWHGRLGRTHMVDVDRMHDSRRVELDSYLLRTINAIFPVRSPCTAINAVGVFATLSSFGLRMEDRGPLADDSLFAVSNVEDKPTITRLQNCTAYYYTTGTNQLGDYWNASALETLTELARYRGLFTAEGFLEGIM